MLCIRPGERLLSTSMMEMYKYGERLLSESDFKAAAQRAVGGYTSNTAKSFKA